MKKIIAIVLIVLAFNYPEILAADYLLVWEKTIIEVDVYDSIENYLNTPRLLVIKGGKEISANVTYLKGDDKFSISTINTGVIGDYRLNYYAEVKGLISNHELKSETQVIFRVVDRLKPTLEVLDKTILLGEKFDYLSLIHVEDNYSKKEKITLTYNAAEINIQKTGVYSFFVKATDEAGNNSFENSLITVVDKIKPVISCNSTKVIIPFQTLDFNLKQFYTAVDNHDGDISHLIQVVKNVDTSKLGQQSIILNVIDYSGNEGIYEGTVEVSDSTKPKLVLKDYFLDLDINNDYNQDFFKNIIDYVFDKENILTKEDVIINMSQFKQTCGVYKIVYSLTDGINEVMATLCVTMLDLSPPIVSFTDAVLKKGEAFNYLDYVTISKKENTTYTIHLVSSNVNINVIGEYLVQIEVVDNKELKTVGSFKVLITKGEEQIISNSREILYLIVIIALILFLLKKHFKNKEDKC